MGGGLLIVAGVWVLCQVFGGDALGRLGVTGRSAGDIQAVKRPEQGRAEAGGARDTPGLPGLSTMRGF